MTGSERSESPEYLRRQPLLLPDEPANYTLEGTVPVGNYAKDRRVPGGKAARGRVDAKLCFIRARRASEWYLRSRGHASCDRRVPLLACPAVVEKRPNLGAMLTLA